jgi:hypothetical protein
MKTVGRSYLHQLSFFFSSQEFSGLSPLPVGRDVNCRTFRLSNHMLLHITTTCADLRPVLEFYFLTG